MGDLDEPAFVCLAICTMDYAICPRQRLKQEHHRSSPAIALRRTASRNPLHASYTAEYSARQSPVMPNYLHYNTFEQQQQRKTVHVPANHTDRDR